MSDTVLAANGALCRGAFLARLRLVAMTIVRAHDRYKRPPRGRNEMMARVLGIVLGLGCSAAPASAQLYSCGDLTNAKPNPYVTNTRPSFREVTDTIGAYLAKQYPDLGTNPHVVQRVGQYVGQYCGSGLAHWNDPLPAVVDSAVTALGLRRQPQ